MASFQKRGKTWQYCVSAKPKPIRKGGFKTKKEAMIAAAEVEAKLSKNVPVVVKEIPFDEYFEKWVNLYKQKVSDSTLSHYGYTLQEIREFFGSKPIQKIQRHDYQEFLNNYGSTKSKVSVEKLHSHIKACVEDAVEEGIIKINFTRKAVKTWTVQAKRDEEKYLNYLDSKKLTRELYKRLDRGLGYYLLLLGLTSGLRFGELVGLTRKDFNFFNNTITVNKTWGYAKRHPEGFGPTKNEQSKRVIKINKGTMTVFRRLFEKMPSNIHGLVFYSPSSKYKIISNTNVNNLLKKVLTDLKIDPIITVHGLRHTHASVLLYRKVSIHYISERLGHADIETTSKVYAHLIKELREQDESETVNIFEEMAGEGVENTEEIEGVLV
ncbi:MULTISPECIES: tyrosine-type recombinase/integrase [Bacillus]|uniref:tyrosine-type recombinase/integrase n=1 Tax=Bacillus TaxID=1386 RepID=UPI00263A6CDC|nr:tyrosine-type recombinase/integrase [Bacillus glycinifermentans]MEC0497188.1 tyrosine-type recombinase/integrase [Bacillus glycinifermentans]WKB77928.1 tyrosine-type recombinase/integrase [Bacillus glycinifermentans]